MGLYFRAAAATGSFCDIISDFVDTLKRKQVSNLQKVNLSRDIRRLISQCGQNDRKNKTNERKGCKKSN